MQIRSIRAYQMRQPFVDGPYRMSKGRVADAFDAVIVALGSDDGLTGWGEMAPLGNFYSAAFAAGAAAGVAEIAPHLLGRDPRALGGDRAADGHRVQGPSLHQVGARHGLLGPRRARRRRAAGDAARRPREGGGPSSTRWSPTGTSRRWRRGRRRIVAEGFGRLQVKVGGNVQDDIERVHGGGGSVPKGTVMFCDANAGWTPFQARQFADATRDVDYTFEQPCTSIDENACRCGAPSTSRWCSTNPCWGSLETCWRSNAVGAADGLTLKISRLGGVTKTRQIRDLAVELGFMVTVEDTGGAEIDTAAMAHLSLSTPEERPAACHRLPRMGDGADRRRRRCLSWRGRMGVPDGPGLGIDVLPEKLGEPFLALEA